MTTKELRDLEKKIKLLRKNGVFMYKTSEIELHLTPLPITNDVFYPNEKEQTTDPKDQFENDLFMRGINAR